MTDAGWDYKEMERQRGHGVGPNPTAAELYAQTDSIRADRTMMVALMIQASPVSHLIKEDTEEYGRVSRQSPGQVS